MRFITSDISKRNIEFSNFNKHLNLWGNLFSKKNKLDVLQKIVDNIDEVHVYIDHMHVDRHKYSYVTKNNDTGHFRLTYGNAGAAEELMASLFREFAHATLTIGEGRRYKNGTMLALEGASKYDLIFNENYATSLNDGLIDVMSNLAVIKNINPTMTEDYLRTGKFSDKPSNNLLFNEVARLLTLASVNYYEADYIEKLAETINGDEGIESTKINSLFISSALNNDFVFENEFDYFLGSNSYKKFSKSLDLEKDRIKSMGYYSSESADVLIEKIKLYHTKKNNYLSTVGHMSKDKHNKLLNSFDELCEATKKNLGITGNQKKI